MEREMTDAELEAPLDEALEAEIDRALAQARDFHADEQASSVRYLQAEDLYVVVLKSGVRLAIPVMTGRQACC